ncbi:MAG TPA: glycosyl hydrolase [Edaphobacter sp.]|nr:glycosyl hydrolase [Edaphobacter sp.]
MRRFSSRFPQTTLLVTLAISTATFPAFAESSMESLKLNFKNPPSDARPMMRWWWFGTAVEKPEILRELQEMKADGIGGAELAFVYPEVLDSHNPADPAKDLKNLPFLSPAMLDAVHFTQAEARRLGLRIDVTLCSGWPYGGPNTTLAEAASRLRTIEVPVAAHALVAIPPALEQGDSIISASIVAKIFVPCSFENGSVCGAPPPTPAGGRNSTPPPLAWDATTAQPLTLNGSSIIITPSDKPRTALFFIASHTKQQVKRAAVEAEGYVLDPFSHQAVATHLQKVGEPLVKAFGDIPPYAIFSDSLEAYGADWTPTLPAEFLKRRGYDLLPHLPELVAGGTPAAEKVRHDWGQTLTELVNENYLTQINNWAIAHHTKFRSQTYGEPAVTFSSQNLVALPEGEGPQWRAFSTLRWATSANHVFGNNITSGETFTWLHSPVFRATPLDMKAEADIDFIVGENQIVGHGWPYSPPGHKVPEPGWSLYAAGAFNDHNPWHPVMPDVTRYIQRISWLLRQGQPANQVAILLPTDDAWASFSPAHVTVTGAMQRLISPALMSAILSAGYNVDFIDAEAINKVGLGTHQILILPPTDRIPVETLKKILDWSVRGGKTVAVGRIPTLDPEGNPSAEITELTKTIMLVPYTAELTKALDKIGDPDFKLTSSDDHTKEVVGFIRRKLPTADIYFVTNTSNRPLQATANFDTTHRDGEQWDPETGQAAHVTASNLALNLAPYESRVFIFAHYSGSEPPRNSPSDSASITPLVDLSTDWRVTFTGTKETETEPTLTDWTTNPATLYYSGEAIYARDFTINTAQKNPVFLEIEGGKPLTGSPNSPPEHEALGPNGLPDPRITRTGPGMHAYYDPPIHEAAIVFLNGQRAGSLWHPPYQLDVSKFLKPGQNHIEIHVYNTALNAWSKLPPHDYKPLIEKYGDRFQMQDLDKVQPIPSGILGPIHLVTQDTK